jgi:PAS domain S-box-containing protein
MRRTFWISSGIVVAFLISLIVRATGSYNTPVDGWGVDLFELSMSAICIRRYFDRSWASHQTVFRVFPLVIGAAALSWALGDVALTVQSLGGATVSVPSVADIFYVGFFPLCYLGFMLLVRRGNHGSLIATSLDGLIVGLGVASLSAAFFFNTLVRTTHGSVLSTATNMSYPIGDFLLLALALGSLAVLPEAYRRFFAIASVAVASNAAGDLFNLFQPNSKIGYVTNSVAWPISLLLLAIAVWVLPSNVEPVGTTKTAKAEKASAQRTAGFVMPAVGGLAGMAILFVASFGKMGRPALGLASATLLVAGVRLVLSVRQAQALNSARFRSLIDNAWDLIVVTEADFNVAFTTPSSQRVLGFAPEELQARSITHIAHPDDAKEMIARLSTLADANTETAVFETRMRHHNGAWRTIAWTATNLLDDPSVRGYVLNGGDVTEARQAAEDLAAARDGALLASKAKSEFLSTMSHEIRTPMNGVIGLTELLLETNLSRDQHELASGVKVSAENLLVIINDILDFSKIEAGKLEVEEVAFNVSRVADDVGRILAPAASSKGIELLVDVHPDVPLELMGDGVRIQQVLLNLGSNAVKFTSEGEVVIRVSVLDEKFDRVALRFDVIDMGIGIAASDQDRLFNAFAQADSSTTRRFGGTGLGLAICRQLVELMGGSMGLRSAPGDGSTFWFDLSLRRTGSANLQGTAVGVGSLSGLRALIVDDNATNRMILSQQMLSWGVEAAEAVDAYQALGLAASAAERGEAFDLGILDLNMPGMDGVELAGHLKSDPATKEMLLFLLSSSGDLLGAAESHVRGFAGSLTKPVRQSELFDLLITSLVDGAVHAPVKADETNELENAEVNGLILLVEDNKMNQLVGSKVLSKLGFEFRIASHGGEAVAAVKRERYDAILMDCQMPEMDGYEATIEIRRIEGASRRTPIIAMTAAAMDGDREICLAAGMDDYITKPVRLDAIADILTRWVTMQKSVEDEPVRNEVTPVEGSIEALDGSQIDLLRSLDDGDGAVLGEIVEQFLTQTEGSRAEIERAIADGDGPAVERCAHTLRGASANIGAVGLASVCAQMEQRGRAGELGGAALLVPDFDTEFMRVRGALNLLLEPSA